MRPKKTRVVRCSAEERCFRPRGIVRAELAQVHLTLDEFESLRLSDVEKISQAQAAGKMRVSRPTYSRILSAAHGKVADGLVHLKEILIEGGCCQLK